jgi:hypothetical protein
MGNETHLMPLKPTIIACVLALLSVVAAVALTSRQGSLVPRSVVVAMPLVSSTELPVESVTRITLSRRGEAPMVFERHGMDWMQIEPFRYPMDRYSMRQLAAVAQQVQVVQRLREADLTDALRDDGLGLNPPEAEIVYEWDEGSLRLSLGRRGIAGRAYLRKGEESDITIVRQNLHERALEMSPREWRDRTLFQNVSVEADRITRTLGNQALVLERDRRRWMMVEPVQTRVDGEALEALIQLAGGARSAGFLVDQPTDLTRFGLARPAAKLTITTTHDGTSTDQRLRVGMVAGAGTQDRYGIVDGFPVVVRVPMSVLQGLFRQAETLIDPTGAGVHAADVRSIRINTPTEEIQLERDLERWQATSHQNQQVSPGYVEQLLSQLTELRAGSVRIMPYPRELEVATVTLIGFRAQPLTTVRVVYDPSGDSWALENGDDVLRVFPGSFSPRLTAEDFGLTSIIDQ